MAIRFDNTTDYLSRTTSLPPIASFTIMSWAQLSVDKNDYVGFFSFGESSGGRFFEIGTFTDGVSFHLYNGSVETSGSALTVGVWYHCSLVVSGTGVGASIARIATLTGVLQTLTLDGNAAMAAQELIFGSGNSANLIDFMNGRLAAVKIYNAPLTLPEILTEMPFYLPQRQAHLNASYPLLTHVENQDISQQGQLLTINGTLTTEDGPPIAWAPYYPLRIIPSIPVQANRVSPIIIQQAVHRAASY